MHLFLLWRPSPPPAFSAAHLLSDVLAFLISLFAIWISKRPASGSLTWGSHRYELVGAVLSVFLVWLLTALLLVEAVDRILYPEEVDGKIMFITALLGFLVNLAMMKILHQDLGGGHSHGGHSHASHGHSHGGHANLNVSAAFIHVVGDLIQSIGVMIAAVIIWVEPSLTIVDPICTFVFSILVLFTTWGVLKSALRSTLTSSPEHVSLPGLTRALLGLRGVTSMYGLHVWEYGGAGDKTRVACEAHLVCRDSGAMATVLEAALSVVGSHGITHPTIQVEPEGRPGGVTDAAGVSLEVFEAGAEPSGGVGWDIFHAITGWRPFEKPFVQPLYTLAPSSASLGLVTNQESRFSGGNSSNHPALSLSFGGAQS